MKYIRINHRARLLVATLLLTSFSACEFAVDSFSENIIDPTIQEASIEGLTSVQVNAFLPTSTEVTIQSGNTESFALSASSQRGEITYSFLVDDVEIQKGKVGTFSFESNSYSVGTHELKAVATDGVGVESVTWQVKKNAAPVMAGCTPSTSSVYKVSSGSLASFSVGATDENNDALTFSWALDGSASGLTVTSSGSSSTMSFTATPAQIGARSVTLTVSDGSVSSSCSWNLEVNAFISQCNNLTAGQICSYVGYANVGGGYNPVTQANSFILRPRSLAKDGDNLIIGDDLNHVIWYWNRSGADVVRFNKTIVAGSISVIAGVGAAGAAGLNGIATDAGLSTPIDMAFVEPTAGDERLYVVESGNNRIVRINAGGVIAQLSPTGCTNPRSIAVLPDASAMFIGCYGSHRVIKFDGTTTTIVLGTGTAGHTGDAGNANAALITNPSSVRLDNAGNLYVLEATPCRIRMVNRTNTAVVFYATSGTPITVAANGGVETSSKVNTIVGKSGSTACLVLNPDVDGAGADVGNDETHPTVPAAGTINSTGVIAHITLGSFDGSGIPELIYVADYVNNSIRVVNNSASAVSVGSVSVAANTIRKVVGRANAAGTGIASGYSGEGALSDVTRIFNPTSIVVDSDDNLWYADYNNNRLRYIDGTANTSQLGLGSGILRSGYVGNDTLARETLLNNPAAVLYDATAQLLFYSDYTNHRVRQVDRYGMVIDAVGKGTGAIVNDDDFPGNVTFNSPSGLAFHGSTHKHLLMVDRANHVLRVWNRATTTQTIGGFSVQADRVSRVAGTAATSGCSTGTMDARDILMTNPEGVVSDGSSIYIADTGCNCVRKIASTGVATVVVGTCNAATGNGVTEGGSTLAAASTGLNGPRQLALDTAGNLYITDYGNNKIRFVNLALAASAKLFGGSVTVPVGHVATIVGGSGSPTNSDGVLATSAALTGPFGVIVNGTTGTVSSTGSLCYSGYGNSNVRCLSLANGLVNTVGARSPGANNTGAPVGLEQEGVPAVGTAGSYVYMNQPRMISWDSGSGIFISDYSNHLIRYIK